MTAYSTHRSGINTNNSTSKTTPTDVADPVASTANTGADHPAQSMLVRARLWGAFDSAGKVREIQDGACGIWIENIKGVRTVRVVGVARCSRD